jgi:hypothetical protein
MGRSASRMVNRRFVGFGLAEYGMMNVDIRQRSMLICSSRFTTGARGGFAPLTLRDIGVNR